MSTILGYLIPILLGIGLALLVMSPFLLLFLVRFFAERNVFFTIVNEGSAKAIMRFGRFKCLVMAYEGYAFNTKKGKGADAWEIISATEEKPKEKEEKTKEKKEKEEKDLSLLEIINQWLAKHPGLKKLFGLGGVRWVGWPGIDTVYEYNFRWSTLRETKASEDEEGFQSQRDIGRGKNAVSFAKRIDYILLSDYVYYAELHGVETSEMMPVDVLMLLPVRIMNPYKALFRVQKWLDATLDLIKPSVRAWIATKSVSEVVKKEEVTGHEYDVILQTKPEVKGTKPEEEIALLSEYLVDTYGVRVKRVTFEEIVPPTDYSTAATLQAAANKEAERIGTLRDAEYARFKKITQAVKEEGTQGEMVFAGETIREASKGQATTIFAPFGAIQSLIEGLIGKKGGE